MFQTFSGSSRRPRQVNLSGQNVNPFAPNSWTPSASGTQKTVANAQQERQLRQQERERLNSSKTIQRVWRGHKSRRDLADSRRTLWDELALSQAGAEPWPQLVQQLRLLVAFLNTRRRDDIARIEHFSRAISSIGYKKFLDLQDVRPIIFRLTNLTLEALRSSLPHYPAEILLRLLVEIANHYPAALARIFRKYYNYVSKLLEDERIWTSSADLLMSAIQAPLLCRDESSPTNTSILDAYAAFAVELLTTPPSKHIEKQMPNFFHFIDIGLLSTSIVREFSSGAADKIDAASKLWLLANFIAISRNQDHRTQDPVVLRALSLQLSNSSGEIVGRVNLAGPEALLDAHNDDETRTSSPPPLPTFIRDGLLSLVDETSITGLLAKFNVDYAKASAAGDEDASLLASYALTLLRIFPLRSDELRMWLFRGSLTTPIGTEVPALRFFWHAMSKTNIFSAIPNDPKAALNILQSQTQASSGSLAGSWDREWRTVLLFLELYTFVLRITDDEEFLSSSLPALDQQIGPVSRIRESALPLEDVRHLTIFLKNLAFTTYFNAGELSDDDSQNASVGLGTYFGSTTSPRFQSPVPDAPLKSKQIRQKPFAGIAGMTLDYVRSLVTGVVRMLYERDSRRRFLPKDHWLMTSRFEMEGFIPAVVMEEERRHHLREEGEDTDADEEDDFAARDQDLGLVGMARPRRALHIEHLRKQQQKAARKKVLAAVGPRLEVLQNMPYAIPFETRVQIFRQFVTLDQTRRRGGNVDPDIWRMSMVQNAMLANGDRNSGREVLSRHHAKIRRDSLFEDAYEQFYELGDGLKEPIQITFVDKFDTVEAGIDGGGVTKEFLISVTNEAFRSEDGPNLFITNHQNLLFPNPAALDERRELLKQAGLQERSSEYKENIKELLKQYEFLGRIIGKCLYEGIIVDISFAGFFLLKWAASGSDPGYRPNINDLRDLDEALYQGLLKLKNYPGNVEDFSLDFTITDTVSLPGASTQAITRDLMPNGSNIPVINGNRPLYVSYMARHRLLLQPYQQTQAFLRGLGEIITPSWLSMFNQSELQTLIGGDASEINVEDLRHNTAYGGVYQIGDDGLEHPTIQLFWRVMKDLDNSDRRKVLKYVTSTPRAPLLGFSQLNPRFSIRDAGADEQRLPSTSTCVNLLKLPRYSTATTLREKLLYAINSGAGFDLS